MFDVVWSGRRHVDDGREPDRHVRQPELRVHRLARAADDAAARHARRAGQHDQRHDVVLDPEPLARGCSCRQVDVVSGVGYDRAAELGPTPSALPRARPRRHEPRRARLRDARPPDAAAFGAPGRHGRRGRRRDRLRARRSPATCPSRGCRPTTSCADPRGHRPERPRRARKSRIRDASRTPRRATLFGVEVPIVQTGMGWVAGARLVSATTATRARSASSRRRR